MTDQSGGAASDPVAPAARVEALRARGVRVLDPRQVFVDGDVDPARVDPTATLYPGTRLHGKRTYLGPGAEPLAKVLRGHGNDGESGFEGARYKNAFGCYLHGPLLPKNPTFADHLIGLALLRKYGDATLAPLDDALELMSHAEALKAR